MSSSPVQMQKSPPLFSKRRLGLAGAAAFIGCAACCALPLFAAAGVGSGAVAFVVSLIRPGSELVVAGGVFVGAFVLMAVWSRLNRSEESGCGSACMVDGNCCDRGASR